MSLFRQTAAVFVIGWMTMPVTFVTSVMVARSLGPEGKGVLFLLAGLTGIIAALTSLGANSGAAVLFKAKRHALGVIAASVLLVGLVAVVSLTAIYLIFSDTFIRVFLGEIESFRAEKLWIALALLLVLPSILILVGDALLISDNAMRLYALKNGGGAVIGLGLTWLFAVKLGWGISGVLWAQLAASGFALGVVAWWLAIRGAFAEFRFSMAATKDLLRLGLQHYWVSLISLAAKRFDVFLVTALLSVREAGYYSIAVSLQGILLSIPRSTTWPLVSRFSADGAKDVGTVARVSRVQFLLMAVATAAFAALVGPLIGLVFGANFAPAATAVYWALLGVPWAGPSFAAFAYFTAQGKTYRGLIPAFIAATVQVVLNIVLVPRIGVSGSSLGSTAQLVVFSVAQLIILNRLYGTSFRTLLVPSRNDLAMVLRAVVNAFPGKGGRTPANAVPRPP